MSVNNNLEQLVQKLSQVMEPEQVSTSTDDCVLLAQDVLTKSLPAALIVRPYSTQNVSDIVSIATDAGFAVIARGGGMSYTKSYVPVEQDTVIIDLAFMSEVVEINTQDMYVTVQAGCTWQSLYEALKESDYRTPFWGTLSGSKATVAGAVAQNAIFWGSGQHGFAVDSVLSVEVVLADGTVLNTGASAQLDSTPFMRHYGPDLTGLFCCDSATLGVKTQITLKLIKQQPLKGALSFCFQDFNNLSQAMSEIAKSGLASECFGFDPYLQAQRLKRESLAKDVKSLVGVVKSADSLGKGLKAGMKIALAGRNFVEAESWSVHYVVEDLTQAGVDERLKQIKAIAQSFLGQQVENTIPTVLSAHPFGPVNNMIGPEGERWAPIHALVPHSKALRAYEVTQDILEKHGENIRKFDIGVGYLLATVSSNVFVLEPVFFWPDELNELHKMAVEESHLNRIKGYPANPEARAAVLAIRADLVLAYKAMGAIHMQIGKTYLFQEGIEQPNRALLAALKVALDPDNRMNPQALGFE